MLKLVFCLYCIKGQYTDRSFYLLSQTAMNNVFDNLVLDLEICKRYISVAFCIMLFADIKIPLSCICYTKRRNKSIILKRKTHPTASGVFEFYPNK